MDVTAGRGPETVRLQATRGFGRAASPRELWRYRDVAVEIARRDVTVRYRQTFLGAAWALLQPIGTMVVFSIFFNRVAGIGGNGVPYPLFTLTALVPWTFFSNALLMGSDSLVANSALVTKVYFPRVFIPLGIIVAGLLDLSIAFVILLVVAGIWGYPPRVEMLTLPFFTVVAVAAALGVACGLSAVNARFRDVRYVVPFATQLLLFATPIAYPSSLVHGAWRTLLGLNPMAGVIEGWRWAVLDQPPSWSLIAVSIAAAATLLVGGLAYFERVERRFADLI
jgi:homopolymeric O-antigen transport system permease protein